MRPVIALLILGSVLASCSKKASLSSDEERYVEITLAIMKTRAKVAQQGADSVRLKSALDSIYKVYEIDSAGYVQMSAELAERPSHAVLAYQAIRDSLGLK